MRQVTKLTLNKQSKIKQADGISNRTQKQR